MKKAGDLEQVKNYVSGDLNISYFNLSSLEGCPKIVVGKFNCSMNNLISLDRGPKTVNHFDCEHNQLSSFEHFPKRINGYCDIADNKFTSFKDIDQHIEYLDGTLNATYMNITSGFSDLFGIEGLTGICIVNKQIQYIVNKYIKEKDIINFQDLMIKAGYESYL